MDLTANAIDKIVELTVNSGTSKLEEFQAIDGKQHYRLGNTLVTYEKPGIEKLRLSTLQSLADYLHSQYDIAAKKECPYIFVESPTSVVCSSAIDNETKRKFKLASAEPMLPKIIEFGKHYAPDEFIIALQANFVPNVGHWGDLVKCCGKIKIDNSGEIDDDGISQQVTVQQGVSLAKTIKLPNPVTLAPYRTFPEIEQPESSFVLRVKTNGSQVGIMLVEADGGAWRLEAVKRIKEWLESAMKDKIESGDIVVLA